MLETNKELTKKMKSTSWSYDVDFIVITILTDCILYS